MKRVNCQVFKIKNNLVREALSEFLGTFTLLIFGIGSNAVFVLSEPLSSPALLTIGWGFAVMSGVHVAGGASGGHINPAVTVGMAVSRIFPWKKVPVYILAQYLGAFAACPVMYAVYLDAMNHFDGGVRQTVGENATAGIFATYPLPQVSVLGGFVDQTCATAMLVLMVLAIIDDKNMKPDKGIIPISIGFIIILFTCAFGMNCGCALNPARDLSPRIFTAIAGWGIEPFREYTWFMVPVLGPHLGGIIGACIYNAFIKYHWTFMPESVETLIDSKENLEKQAGTKLQALVNDRQSSI